MRALEKLYRPVCAGIDIGHGRVKVATNVCDPFTFQSTAAPAERIGDGMIGTDAFRPVIVDGKPWIVGVPPKILRNIPQAIHKGAHFSDEHYALFLEALARIGRNIDVLVVGMTVDQIAEKGAAQILKEKFQGEHRAHGLRLNVNHVGVYAQPRGTARLYLDQDLDRMGDQTFMIIDIGEGTTDVNLLTAAIDDDDNVMVTIDRSVSMAEWTGVSQVSEAVAADIGVLPAEVSAALWRGRAVVNDMEIGPLIDRATSFLADNLVTAIKSKIRSFDGVDLILLSGGGAHVFGHHLSDRFGKPCRMIDDAAMANAHGFLLMAEDHAEAG